MSNYTRIPQGDTGPVGPVGIQGPPLETVDVSLEKLNESMWPEYKMEDSNDWMWWTAFSLISTILILGLICL